MIGTWLAVCLLAAKATPTPAPMSLDAPTPVPAVTAAATPDAPAVTPMPASTPTPSALDATPKPVATPAPTPVGTPPPKRIAVVVVGDDSALAGDLQRDLEKRLPVAVPGLVVRPVADIANRAGVRAPVITPEVDPAAAQMLEEAIAAYYEAQYVKALDLFAKVQGSYQASGAPTSKRTQVFLWRVAVFLGLNDSVQAQTEALAALSLNPELKVDPTSEVPPSVQQQLDRAKATSGFKLATVIVNGLPATASLTVDGRSVPSRFKVTHGKHVIVASSAARRDVTREIDVSADTAISMSLPVAFAPEDAAAVAAFVAGGDETPAVAGLAEKLDADWVLFALTTPAETSAVLRRSQSGDAFRTTPAPQNEAPPTLIQFFQTRLTKSLNEKAPPVAGAPRTWSPGDGWAVRVDATLIASGWARTVEGGERFETFFGGAGPEIRIDAANGWKLAMASLSWVSYDGSTVEVRLPDGTKETATGGSTARMVAGAGWRGLGEEGELLRAILALDVESHASNDPANRGAKLNLLTPYTRGAVELRAGSRFAAPALPDWRVDVELGIAPYAYFAERPQGASGDSPASGLGYLWSAGLESPAASQWGYRLTYAGEMRSVKFEGRSDAAVNPPMNDAQLSEMYHSLSLTLMRRF